jgi:hypothetical protein
MSRRTRIKPMRSKLRIGMDFHGIIVDPTSVKQRIAYEITGQWILPELLKREIAVPEGILTNDEYDEMNRRIYETEGSILRAPPVDGAIETILALVKAGHEVDIITASGVAAFKNAVLWCRNHGLEIPGIRLFGVGPDGDKIQVVRRMDIYLDDEFKHLDAVKDVIEHLFLLDRGYNQHERVGHIAKRVANFLAFFREVQRIDFET